MLNEPPEPSAPALACPACDEPFRPELYGRVVTCANCRLVIHALTDDQAAQRDRLLLTLLRREGILRG